MSTATSRPHRLLDKFVSHIEDEGQMTILDIGCGLGQTAIRLANLGHRVMGISNDEAEIEGANKNARRNAIGSYMFEVMDARDLRDNFCQGFFRAVIISDMLHLMSKGDSLDVIESAKHLTAPGGYNAIHGYLVDPTESIRERNRERMFHPGELHDTYDSDPNWQIVEHIEDKFNPILHNGKEHVSSHASIIVRKRLQPAVFDLSA